MLLPASAAYNLQRAALVRETHIPGNNCSIATGRATAVENCVILRKTLDRTWNGVLPPTTAGHGSKTAPLVPETHIPKNENVATGLATALGKFQKLRNTRDLNWNGVLPPAMVGYDWHPESLFAELTFLTNIVRTQLNPLFPSENVLYPGTRAFRPGAKCCRLLIVTAGTLPLLLGKLPFPKHGCDASWTATAVENCGRLLKTYVPIWNEMPPTAIDGYVSHPGRPIQDTHIPGKIVLSRTEPPMPSEYVVGCGTRVFRHRTE